MVLQESVKEVSSVFQSKVFQGILKGTSFKHVSWAFQRSLKGGSRNFQTCFKEVSRRFQQVSK